MHAPLDRLGGGGREGRVRCIDPAYTQHTAHTHTHTHTPHTALNSIVLFKVKSHGLFRNYRGLYYSRTAIKSGQIRITICTATDVYVLLYIHTRTLLKLLNMCNEMAYLP